MNEHDRFWNKVAKTDGCWNWTASTRYGYGSFRVGGRSGRTIMAHRYAYEKCIGPIPKGLQLDHLCRNRACVNPHHLEPVTAQINVLRGHSPAAQQARRTECIHGHPLTGNNLYITPKGRRQCKTCRRQSLRKLAATGYFRERQNGTHRD